MMGIEKIDTMSLEDLQNIHNKKQNELNVLLKKYKHLNNVSVIARVIGVLICLALAGYCFYTAKTENVSWFMKTISIIVGASGGVVVTGVLFLILKPVFWATRKSAKEKLPTIEKAEKELLLIKISIMNYCENNHKVSYTKENYEKFKSTEPSKQLVSKWIKHKTLIADKNVEQRIYNLESSKYSEWQWILSAVVVILAAVALAIAFAIFAVFIAIAIVVIAIICSSNSKDRSYSYQNDNYDDGMSKEPLFERIVHAITGKVWAYSDYYSDLKNKNHSIIKESKRECKKILSQLLIWNFLDLDI